MLSPHSYAITLLVMTILSRDIPVSTNPHVHVHSPGSKLLSLSNLSQGHYRYTANLLALERTAGPDLPQGCTPRLSVVSPLNPVAWEQGLATHPDCSFAEYITRGIRGGRSISATSNASPQMKWLLSFHWACKSAPLGSSPRETVQENGTLLLICRPPMAAAPMTALTKS